jgi:hypothetical protein
LLIAPFASFSTVLSPEPEDDPDDLEDVFREDLAIASISLRSVKRHFKPVTVPE